MCVDFEKFGNTDISNFFDEYITLMTKNDETNVHFTWSIPWNQTYWQR